MTTFDQIVKMIEPLDADELARWIASGWVRPAPSGRSFRFSEIDVARVQLIAEMRFDMMIDDEAMPVVLGLLDQIYGLRHQLKQLERAIQAQPDRVRTAIAEHVARQPDRSGM